MRTIPFEKEQVTANESRDRAVSPVIGVILMVAVAVILAAVVGGFVFTQTDALGDSAPSVSFEYENQAGADTVTIRHAGGDQLDADRVEIKVAGSAAADGEQFSDTITAADSTDVTASAGERIEIVHTGADGDTTILSSWEVPE